MLLNCFDKIVQIAELLRLIPLNFTIVVSIDRLNCYTVHALEQNDVLMQHIIIRLL